jgi:hypothetical protein
MENPTVQQAWIGLLGVGIGALVTLVASVIVPWIRDTLDRKRIEREQQKTELRNALLQAMAKLLAYRQAVGARSNVGEALARYGAAQNEVTVRLTAEQQPVLDVLLAMLAMVQEPRRGVEKVVGEAMQVLTLWACGDIRTDDVIAEVERRASVKFSDNNTVVNAV